MIKGPILPLLVAFMFTLIVHMGAKNFVGATLLGFGLGQFCFLPSSCRGQFLMWQETGSAFFTQAIGEDLLPKLKGGHEKHGGLPGYYLLTTWLAFWPACLFLLPGLAFAIQSWARQNWI